MQDKKPSLHPQNEPGRDPQNHEIPSEEKRNSEIYEDVRHLETFLSERLGSLKTKEDLQNLRQQIEQQHINEDLKQTFLDLIRRIEHMSRAERNELVREIGKQVGNTDTDVGGDVAYLTSGIPLVQGLENSPLGQNYFKDTAGILIGSIDSVGEIIRLAWTLIKDIFLLPRDLYTLVRQKL